MLGFGELSQVLLLPVRVKINNICTREGVEGTEGLDLGFSRCSHKDGMGLQPV